MLGKAVAVVAGAKFARVRYPTPGRKTRLSDAAIATSIRFALGSALCGICRASRLRSRLLRLLPSSQDVVLSRRKQSSPLGSANDFRELRRI